MLFLDPRRGVHKVFWQLVTRVEYFAKGQMLKALASVLARAFDWKAPDIA